MENSLEAEITFAGNPNIRQHSNHKRRPCTLGDLDDGGYPNTNALGDECIRRRVRGRSATGFNR